MLKIYDRERTMIYKLVSDYIPSQVKHQNAMASLGLEYIDYMYAIDTGTGYRLVDVLTELETNQPVYCIDLYADVGERIRVIDISKRDIEEYKL